MNREDIRHGIMLFQYSNTAQYSGRARALIQVLWNLYRSNEISFHNPGRASLHGTWQVRAGHSYIRVLAPTVDTHFILLFAEGNLRVASKNADLAG
ncbi:MAG: hypothetical protein RKR03_00030 [Candidatus Competibacter sp.]|nr:hypothetical protein [Candidatus Competibacter sp.]